VAPPRRCRGPQPPTFASCVKTYSLSDRSTRIVSLTELMPRMRFDGFSSRCMRRGGGFPPVAPVRQEAVAGGCGDADQHGLALRPLRRTHRLFMRGANTDGASLGVPVLAVSAGADVGRQRFSSLNRRECDVGSWAADEPRLASPGSHQTTTSDTALAVMFDTRPHDRDNRLKRRALSRC
jgi:hypothetical protein